MRYNVRIETEEVTGENHTYLSLSEVFALILDNIGSIITIRPCPESEVEK